MRIRQYAYFSLFSERFTAAQITARLLIEPDEVRVRGSRRIQPAVPVHHAWVVACREPGLSVDDQIGRIVTRLKPHTARIVQLLGELADDGDASAGAGVSVVRYFNDDDGEGEQLSTPDEVLQKLPGQHQLLGWHLDRDVLEFLVAVAASLDVDEYG